MERRTSLDIVRAAAVFSVVGIHALAPVVAAGASASGVAQVVWVAQWWSIPALFMVSGILHQASGDGGTTCWLGRRARRLLVPYVLASVGYAAYWQIKRVAGAQIDPLGTWGILEAGVFGTTAAHLWFLPVLFECSVVGWFALRRPRYGRLLWVVAVIGALAFLALQAWGGLSPTAYRLLYRTPLYWLSFYLFGMAWEAWSRHARRFAWPIALAGGVLCVGYPIAREYAEWATAVVVWVGPALLAFGTLALADSREPTGALRAVARVSAYSLGVYLLHYAVVDAAFALLRRATGVGIGLGWALLVWLAAYSVSLAVAVAYRRLWSGRSKRPQPAL